MNVKYRLSIPQKDAGQFHGCSGNVKALPRRVEKSGWEWFSKR